MHGVCSFVEVLDTFPWSLSATSSIVLSQIILRRRLKHCRRSLSKLGLSPRKAFGMVSRQNQKIGTIRICLFTETCARYSIVSLGRVQMLRFNLSVQGLQHLGVNVGITRNQTVFWSYASVAPSSIMTITPGEILYKLGHSRKRIRRLTG